MIVTVKHRDLGSSDPRVWKPLYKRICGMAKFKGTFPMEEARRIASEITQLLDAWDAENLPVAPVPIASGHIDPKDNPLFALSVPEEIK